MKISTRALLSLFILSVLSGCARQPQTTKNMSWKEKFIQNYLEDIAEQAAQEEHYPKSYKGPNNSPFRSY